MTQPTDQEIDNAATRAAIAAKQNAEYDEAQALAEQVLGKGYFPWMKLSLIDNDHRRSGDSEPVATVYKVCRGRRFLSERSRFLRRMADGTVQHADNYETLLGELLGEKHPTRTVEVRGEQVPVRRYQLCWSALQKYEPRSAEQLAEARQKREEQAVEKQVRDLPLFAEQIRAEGVQKKARGK